MAEKYYSLPEAAQKLGKTVADVENLVKTGKLRQFTDATGPVLKASDVDAMAIPDITEGSSIGLTPLEDSTFPPASGPAAPVSPVFDLGTDDFDLSAEDTQLTGKGIDVLGEAGSSSEFKLADDLMGKTAAPAPAEPSLEKIENDVNLDSFGSGSGLLDLSLQADDTSLGGVLDEIYPGADLPVSPEAPAAAAESGTASNAPVGVAAEAEQIFAGTDTQVTTTSALAAAYVEIQPDSQSNALGAMMFVPLLVAIYCLVIMAGAMVGVVPTIATSIQDIIWYIMAGAAALALVIMGVGLMIGKKA